MKSIIKELYNGSLSPVDKPLWKNPKLKKKMDRADELEDRLAELLDGEAKKLFEELCEVQTDITILNGEERFSDGFKTAMRFVTESLHDSEFQDR